jgi:hypothetical protein
MLWEGCVGFQKLGQGGRVSEGARAHVTCGNYRLDRA